MPSTDDAQGWYDPSQPCIVCGGPSDGVSVLGTRVDPEADDEIEADEPLPTYGVEVAMPVCLEHEPRVRNNRSKWADRAVEQVATEVVP